MGFHLLLLPACVLVCFNYERVNKLHLFSGISKWSLSVLFLQWSFEAPSTTNAELSCHSANCHKPNLSCIPEGFTEAGFTGACHILSCCYLISSGLTSRNGSLHSSHLLVTLTGLLKQALPAFQMDSVSILFWN